MSTAEQQWLETKAELRESGAALRAVEKDMRENWDRDMIYAPRQKQKVLNKALKMAKKHPEYRAFKRKCAEAVPE